MSRSYGVSWIRISTGRITRIGPQFWRDLEEYDLLESISKIRCPILFIHGSEDIKCPVSEMEAYYRKTSAPKQSFIIKGADHGFRPMREELYKLVLNWFKTQLFD